MRIALAQLNPTVGDIAGNLHKHLKAVTEAKNQGAELIVFPELSIIGYPPRDLLLKPAVIHLCAQAVQAIANVCQGITAIVGYPEKNVTNIGRPLHNAVAMVRDSKIVAKRFKSLLPTYDVFDETRYFEPGLQNELTYLGKQPLGLSICEDLWNDEQMLPRQLYHNNPIQILSEAGAEILINISASPFVMGKHDFRCQLFGHQAKRHGLPIVYVNQVGANDELVFDGNSVVFDKNGQKIAQAKDFAEDLLLVDLNHPTPQDVAYVPRSGIASIHAALVLGLRDYVRKCGFKSVVMGLSGGIDSALVCALAVEALGAENVHGVALPSRYSSDHSQSDAVLLAKNLGVHYHTIPIDRVHVAMEETLAPLFEKTQPGLAEENMQARIRGNLLMALSNKFGHLLLTTGNKSEIATGYCTLYGDMAGGLAIISDVPKMMVYELSRYINHCAWERGQRFSQDAGQGPIPSGTLTKPPSAELRPDQKDQDSLPPYEVLDAILHLYIEEEKSLWDIVQGSEGGKEGGGGKFDEATVLRVIRMVDLNEYKRKQMPPGIKVTSRAFGFGRRMPIAQRYDPKLMNLKE